MATITLADERLDDAAVLRFDAREVAVAVEEMQASVRSSVVEAAQLVVDAVRKLHDADAGCRGISDAVAELVALLDRQDAALRAAREAIPRRRSPRKGEEAA